MLKLVIKIEEGHVAITFQKEKYKWKILPKMEAKGYCKTVGQ